MIVAEGIARRFRSREGADLEVLRRVDLVVETGSVCMLVGPNGSGKSTLLRILAGVLRPSAGRAAIAGHDVERDATSARGSIGFLPERAGVPRCLSPLWHVAFHASLRGIKRAAALDRSARLLSAVGVGGALDRPARGLSRGTRLKVALARALVHEPAVLLLDEPTAHLDHDAVSWLAGTLRSRADAGASVLIATHDTTLIHRAGDRLAVLRKGRTMMEEGSRP